MNNEQGLIFKMLHRRKQWFRKQNLMFPKPPAYAQFLRNSR
jgi:hypothetical protein